MPRVLFCGRMPAASRHLRNSRRPPVRLPACSPPTDEGGASLHPAPAEINAVAGHWMADASTPIGNRYGVANLCNPR